MADGFPDALEMPPGARYTARYPMALAYAAVKHADQARKDAHRTPYIGHPVAVSMLVFQYVEPSGLHAEDVPEDLAIAALLHDVAEDAGGRAALQEIAQLFGERVAEIVDSCSDALPAPGEAKQPWRQRKEAYLRRIERIADLDGPVGDPGACLVIACDKLHNLSETAADVVREGDAALAPPRFAGGPEGTRWYFAALRQALAPAVPAMLRTRIDERLAVIGAAQGRP